MQRGSPGRRRTLRASSPETELEQLEAAVELPEFAAQLVALLHAGERSSVRSLAVRQLSRLEPETLALHAHALVPALGSLAPHEAATPAAELLAAKLLGRGLARAAGRKRGAPAVLADDDLRRRIRAA